MPCVDTVQMCTKLQWIIGWSTLGINLTVLLTSMLIVEAEGVILLHVETASSVNLHLHISIPCPKCVIYELSMHCSCMWDLYSQEKKSFKTAWNGAMRSVLGVPHKLHPRFLTHPAGICHLKHTLKVILIKCICSLVQSNSIRVSNLNSYVSITTAPKVACLLHGFAMYSPITTALNWLISLYICVTIYIVLASIASFVAEKTIYHNMNHYSDAAGIS